MAINEKMKWPTDKKKYDKNYLRLYGEKCPKCKGEGAYNYGGKICGRVFCRVCKGIGYVEKEE